MTNEEIRKKYLSGIVAIKTQRLKKFEQAINKARKDERERVIDEVEKWFKREIFLKLRTNISIGEITAKLNTLKSLE